ncbi:unnamed protein product [Amoebophrya sp. A120]|nr:unnamed protein product [Amoebophrya sp. A120]|eukprot:GSA120T00025661001.1
MLRGSLTLRLSILVLYLDLLQYQKHSHSTILPPLNRAILCAFTRVLR